MAKPFAFITKYKQLVSIICCMTYKLATILTDNIQQSPSVNCMRCIFCYKYILTLIAREYNTLLKINIYTITVKLFHGYNKYNKPTIHEYEMNQRNRSQYKITFKRKPASALQFLTKWDLYIKIYLILQKIHN